MIRSTRWLTATVFFACNLLAACSGSSSSSSSSTGTAPQSAVGAGSGPVISTNASYTIAGVVSGISAAGVALTGGSSNATRVDASGNYSFASVAAGNYTISPAKTGYVFNPVSRAQTVTTASVTDVNFEATPNNAATYSISGTVSGSVAAGVEITLNGTNSGSVLTDLSGNYTFSGLVDGSYTVSPSLDGTVFSAPLIVSLGGEDSVGNDFTSAAASTAGTFAFAALSALPDATVGTAYSHSVVRSVTGGTGPYRYQADTLSGGAPPLGMIVNPNGHLTGTPETPGQYSFSICATDAVGQLSSCEATSLNVVAAGTPSTPPAPPPAPPPPATSASLAASPSAITAGAVAELAWTSKNATSCAAAATAAGWSGTKANAGNATVKPTANTTYELTCTGPNGSAHASATVTVTAPPPTTPPPPAPTVSLTASAASIPPGSSTTLKWSSKNASSCARRGGWTGVGATNGTLKVTPSSTTTYTLACTSAVGTALSSAKITVDTVIPTVTLAASSTSITAGGSSTLTWSSTNASACTASGGWTGAESLTGTKSVSPAATATYTVECAGPGGNSQASVTVTVTTPSVPVASGISWVYYNGLLDWPGDYSFMAKADYHDKSGGPLSGQDDIKVTLQSPYGGWLPYAQNWKFNSAPYTKLTFALKPTVEDQQWSVYFVKVGDIPVGISINVSQFGPKPVAGQWNTYTVPLADLGVLGSMIYKFCIQDKTGLSNNTWYVDNVGFEP